MAFSPHIDSAARSQAFVEKFFYDCEVSHSSRPEDELESSVDQSAEQSVEQSVEQSGVSSTSASGIGAHDDRPPLTTRAASMLGRVISGRYRIVEAIAHGGMGTVFRGDHLHMRKRVAIKILHAETEGLPGLVAQFEREAIAGAHISHPNVAIATDFGELEDGSYFLVLEYVRGVTLTEVLKSGPLPQVRAVHVAKQIASALHAVHTLGIVHRDVKPINIMLLHCPNDKAKLIDFGFAKVPVDRISADVGHEFAKDRNTITDPDTIFGTIGYLAPEAALGMDAVDGRADLYALGVIMYEMLTGKRPFEAEKNAELFQMHRLKPPPPFRERTPDVTVHPAIEAVVMKLLDKLPSHRYQSGEELVAALERAFAATLPPPPAPRPRIELTQADLDLPLERPRSRSGLWAVLILLTAGAGAAVYMARERRGSAGEEAEPAAEVSAAPPPRTEVDGLGAGAWTARLLAAPAARDWQGGSRALAALAELDPTVLRNPEAAKAASAVALDATRGPERAAAADEVYELLAKRFGGEGLDILYGIAESKRSPDGAKRALSWFRQPKILDRATPALRVTLELKEADCEQKAKLFDRAVAHGDKRTLSVLASLRTLPCRGVKDPCCFITSKPLRETIAALQARLSKKN